MDGYVLSIEYKAQKEWAKPYMWIEMAIGGICGGAFIGSLLAHFAMGVIISAIVLIAGKGLFLLADLGKPSRFLRIFLGPNSSWIAKGSWGFLAFIIFAVLTALPLVFTSLPWDPWSGVGLVFSIIAALAAVFLMFYDAFALADSKGIEFWNSSALAPLYLSSAVVGGFALTSICYGLLNGEVLPSFLAQINTAAVVFYALSLYSLLTLSTKSSGAKQLSASQLSKGKQAGVFWVGVVVCSIVVPAILACATLAGFDLPLLATVVADVLVVIGVAISRYSILKVGFYEPVI
jgi:formate-dependent nitrite reductase membrane component NrfD